MTDRNVEILKCLEDDTFPVLPFETGIAIAAMREHVSKQNELSALMGQAMQQSSETWHDNAPAEAIASESKVLADAAIRTSSIIHNAVIFDYDLSYGDRVTLGSIVNVRYLSTGKISTFLITGTTRNMPPEIADAIGSDVTPITLSSPIAKAIFDKHPGDSASFQIQSGKTIDLYIESVTQLQL